MVEYGVGMALDMLHRYSDEEIEELSRRNPAYSFERTSEGELVVSPPAGWKTSRRNSRLIARLDNWNRRFGGGGAAFDSAAGFTLPDGALLSPDAAWMSATRLDRLCKMQPGSAFGSICPELVFELLSPSDWLAFGRRKIDVYLRNGALCAVLIDPKKKTFEVADQSGRRDATDDSPSLVIPLDFLPSAKEPFVVDLTEIFADEN